jgi:hypothetical protein
MFVGYFYLGNPQSYLAVEDFLTGQLQTSANFSNITIHRGIKKLVDFRPLRISPQYYTVDKDRNTHKCITDWHGSLQILQRSNFIPVLASSAWVTYHILRFVPIHYIDMGQ